MHSYYLGEKTIKRKIILITGTSRSGKTTLSKLLASCSNVFWIEEPYSLMKLIELYGISLISKDLFTMMFTSIVNELINDTILYRNANFRPNDLSSIWNYKTAKDVFYHLYTLHSRKDVEDYITGCEPSFIIDIPEISRFIPLIKECFENLIVINVIRNGFDVADACYKKEWFTDNNFDVFSNNIHKQFRGKKIPYWLPEGYEEKYVNADSWERGVMYWTEINRCLLSSDFADITVKYESLTEKPQDCLNSLTETLHIKQTELSASICSSIKYNFDEKLEYRELHYCNYDKKSFEELMEKYGYEHNQ